MDAEASHWQRREVAVRDLLHDRVGVALHRSAASGEWTPGLTFTVDERLPGVSAEVRPVSAAGERDLSGLVSVPVKIATELGVPIAADRHLPEL